MGSRILLADDSITIQKVVNLTFADEGIEVIAVSNGDVAERRLNEIKPDLVLADIFMPGKNGYELCEAIKQSSQFRNVPVVLLVGAFEPFDQVEARRVQADAHLTKPFESRTLVETVRRLISTSSGTPAGPIASMPSPDEDREAVRDADPPVFNSPAAKLDLSAMMVDLTAAPVTMPARNTGELASPSGVFDFGDMDTPACEVVNASPRDTSERSEAMESSSNGEFAFDMPGPFGADEQDMVLDFDKSDPLESPAHLSTVSFETEASTVLDVDVSGPGEAAEWSSRDVLETQALGAPQPDEAWPTNTEIPTFNRQTSKFRGQTEAAFAASDGSCETASATLLAVDEPLGDVLLDETGPAGVLPFSSHPLDLELTEPEVTKAVASTQFDLIDTVEDKSSQASVAVEENIEGGNLQLTEDTLTLDEQPANVLGSPAESHPASADVAADLDWTSPRTGVYTTAQLDSVMTSINPAKFPRKDSADDGTEQPENVQEASFESAKMWPEEAAHFTAIDIEAFPVQDAEAFPKRMGVPEPDLQASSLTPEQPATNVETMPATATAEPPSETMSTAELSSVAIDEIVRRVVAQMSSSVVREVAWEVVPDCVERVIDQLTRESLLKRA